MKVIWIFAILWALAVNLVAAAAEWPIVIGSQDETNWFEFPQKATHVLIAQQGLEGRIAPIQSCPNGKQFFVTPYVQGPIVVASRVLIDNRWGQIHPILVERKRRLNSSFEWQNPIQPASGTVKEGESVKIKIPSFAETNLRLEIVANRLGSQLDPLVIVRNNFGKEIVRADDSDGCERDVRLVLAPWGKADYTMEIKDVTGTGGGTHFFVIRAAVDTEFDGHMEAMPWLKEPPPPRMEKGTDSSDKPERAARIQAPFERWEGFEKKGDDDWYELSVEAGSKLIARVRTREIGSSCDAAVGLYDAKGVLLKESVGVDALGPAITNRFEKAGVYRLRLREIAKLGGDERFYILNVDQSKPGIELTADLERLDFSKEGEAKIKIDCARFDYDGPVKLEVDGLPEGISIVESTIAAKKNEGELKLKRDKNVPAFQIRIRGRIERGDAKGAKEEFPVSTMPALKKLFPLQMFPCAAMDGWIAVNPPPG